MFVHSSSVQRSPPPSRQRQRRQQNSQSLSSTNRTYNGTGICTIYRVAELFHTFVSILVFVTTTLVIAAESDINTANVSSYQSPVQYKSLVIDNRNYAIKMINASAFSSAVYRRSIPDDLHQTMETVIKTPTLCNCSSGMTIMPPSDHCVRVCLNERNVSGTSMPSNTTQRNIECCGSDKMAHNDTFNSHTPSDLTYNTANNHTTTIKTTTNNAASNKLRANESNDENDSNSITWQPNANKSNYANNGHKAMEALLGTYTPHQTQHDNHSGPKDNANMAQLSSTSMLVEQRNKDFDAIQVYDSIDTVSDAKQPMAANVPSKFENCIFST